MLGPYLKETLANWAADFAHGDRIGLFPTEVQGVAQAVLETLLTTACERRGVDSAGLEEEDLKHALLEHVARLDLPAEVRPFVPSRRGCLAADEAADLFLIDLHLQGADAP